MSVHEAEILLREPKRLRIDIFYDMLQQSKTKVTPKSQKRGKITRTDSDVSLSESLLDTLFSEDDGKNDDLDRSRNKSRNKSLDVSEVVTACLDNMAAKTGITKIQRQSHMDRWLQKAKSKTPEKNQLKVAVEIIEKEKDKPKGKEKDTKTSDSKKNKKFIPKETIHNPSPYSFRKSIRESQHLLSHQNEHDYSKYLKRENDVFLKTIVDTIEPVQNICVIEKIESLNENFNATVDQDDIDEEMGVAKKDQSVQHFIEVKNASDRDEKLSGEDGNLNENYAQNKVNNTEVLDANFAEPKYFTAKDLKNSIIVESDQPIVKDVVNATEIAQISDSFQAPVEQSSDKEIVSTEEAESLEHLDRDFDTPINGDTSIKSLDNDLHPKTSDKENSEVSTTDTLTAALKEDLLCNISSEKMDVDQNIHENMNDGEINEYELLDILYENLGNSIDITKKSCVKVNSHAVLHESKEVIGVTAIEDAQNDTLSMADSVIDIPPDTNNKDIVSQEIEKKEIYSTTFNEQSTSTVSNNNRTQENIKTKTESGVTEIVSVDEDATNCESSNVITSDVANDNEIAFLDVVKMQPESTAIKKTIETEMSTDNDITDCENIVTFRSDVKINTTQKETVELDYSEFKKEKAANDVCDFGVKKEYEGVEGFDLKNAVVLVRDLKSGHGTVSIEKNILHEGVCFKEEIILKNTIKNCIPFHVEKFDKVSKEDPEIIENGYDDYSDDDDDIEQPVYSPHCPQAEEKDNQIIENLEIITQQNVDSETVSMNSIKSDISINQLQPQIVNVTFTSTQTVPKAKDNYNEIKTEFESDNDSMSSELDTVALSDLRKAFKTKSMLNGNSKLSKGTVDSKAANSDTEVVFKRELRSRISKSPSSSIKENGFLSSKDASPERVVKQEYDTLSIISINSEDSNTSVSKRKGRKERQASADNMQCPEFLTYLELRQDGLMDEHPELTNDEIVSYLFKTWQYEDSKKSDLMKIENMESSHLVKGVINSQELNQQKKKKTKQRKIVDIVKVIENEDFKPREKRKTIEPLYKEDFSDVEDEIEMFEIFKSKNKVKLESLKAEPSKARSENMPQVVEKSEDNTEASAEIKQGEFIGDIEEEYYDEEEAYFELLTKPKPNVFRGMGREKLCDICEKSSNLVKCKGCQGMFHIDCVNKKVEDEEVPLQSTRGRKKNKKKRGRKPKVSIDSNGVDSGSQSDEKSQDPNVSEELNMSFENVEPELEPLVVDADSLETQLEAKMKELVDPNNIEYESYSSDDGIDWSSTVAGQCEIVEIKLKSKPPSMEADYSDFKCKNCVEYEVPICFVCKFAVSPKDKSDRRQKCQVPHCYKYYHTSCLDQWPQTQFNSGEPSRNNKKINEHFEALTCPRHVCHTCVCDDPRGCKTRFSSDKLARCVRCPATYHSFTKCLPAGTQILTASHIICPRHYEHR